MCFSASLGLDQAVLELTLLEYHFLEPMFGIAQRTAPSAPR